MNSVEKVKALCKERKIPISRLEKELGYANGYIGQLRKGTFPDDRLVEIANYLNVPTAYLTGEEQKNKPAPEGELDEKRKQLIQFIRTTDDKMIDFLLDFAERVKPSENK
jgi:transcriptional regulator with XRE-family HTH domain